MIMRNFQMGNTSFRQRARLGGNSEAVSNCFPLLDEQMSLNLERNSV